MRRGPVFKLTLSNLRTYFWYVFHPGALLYDTQEAERLADLADLFRTQRDQAQTALNLERERNS